jgi:uncharacterized membrane protein YsdA (DUF1294 family)/cold shock CspA family protein
MRYAGRISDWNDEKGFGFVVPNGGGTRAFVHIRQFQRGSRRPVAGDLISYLPVVDERGRTNAQQIRHAGEKVVVPRTPSRFPRAVLGICVLGLIGGAAAFGLLPPLLLGAYLGLSVLSYLLYWWDKSAAQKGARRTPENNLHLMDLLGGWPGALVAQQQFHHKTAKASFQAAFWVTVFLNVGMCIWLVESGLAAEVAQAIGG